MIKPKLACNADFPSRAFASLCHRRLFESITLVPNSICLFGFLSTFKNSVTATTVRHLTYDCSLEDSLTDLATVARDATRGQRTTPGQDRWSDDLQRRLLQLKESQYSTSPHRGYANEPRELDDLTAVFQLLRNCRSVDMNLGHRSKSVFAPSTPVHVYSEVQEVFEFPGGLPRHKCPNTDCTSL
jgi:hypothetical protein